VGEGAKGRKGESGSSNSSAQSEESSVIYGMPGTAVKLGAAKYILSPEQIAGTIEQIVKRSSSRNK